MEARGQITEEFVSGCESTRHAPEPTELHRIASKPAVRIETYSKRSHGVEGTSIDLCRDKSENEIRNPRVVSNQPGLHDSTCTDELI
jgi:hypothetical protein